MYIEFHGERNRGETLKHFMERKGKREGGREGGRKRGRESWLTHRSVPSRNRGSSPWPWREDSETRA